VTYSSTAGVLKHLNEALLPDVRFSFLAIDSPSGSRRFQLADLHARLSDIKLSNALPEDVLRQFETARNLMLYAWFVFEFQTIAELQGYATLELALRTRFPDAKRAIRKKSGEVVLTPLTLGPLLQLAVKRRAIAPEKLVTYEQAKSVKAFRAKMGPNPTGTFPSPKEWLSERIRTFPILRNRLAHGRPSLDLFGSLRHLEICADLVNALFPSASTAP
jgi:hypothetical protein